MKRPWVVVLDVAGSVFYERHASCATEEKAWRSARNVQAQVGKWVSAARIKRIGVRGPFEDGTRVKWLEGSE